MTSTRILIGCLVLMFLLCLLGICAVSIGLGPGLLRNHGQEFQDQIDQRALSDLFDLPGGLTLVAYDGYPAMVGFGQREGLSLNAAYVLTDQQETEFIRRAIARGWEPLPMPESLRVHIPIQGLKVPLEVQSGLFYCRTAGDNVLHAAKTSPCAEAGSMNDIIIGVLDSSQNRLMVEVRSGY